MNGEVKRVPWFDADEHLKPGVKCLIVGKSHTGKSWLLHDWIQKMSKFNFKFGVAFTPNTASADMFARWMPRSFVKKQSPELLDQQNRLAKQLAERENAKGKPAVPNFIFTDDTAFDSKFSRSLGMSELFMNGRHHGTTAVHTIQYLMKVMPETRTNADIVACAFENQRHVRKAIWSFWFSMVPTFKEFEEVFDEATLQYGFLVLNTRKAATSRSWKECVSWYRVKNDPAKLPPMKLLPENMYRIERLRSAAITAAGTEDAAARAVVRLNRNGQIYRPSPNAASAAASADHSADAAMLPSM